MIVILSQRKAFIDIDINANGNKNCKWLYRLRNFKRLSRLIVIFSLQLYLNSLTISYFFLFYSNEFFLQEREGFLESTNKIFKFVSNKSLCVIKGGLIQLNYKTLQKSTPYRDF